MIDTSNLEPRELKEKIAHYYESEKPEKRMHILIISFGYKYGLPLDADLVFDVLLAQPLLCAAPEALTGGNYRGEGLCLALDGHP